MNIAKSIAESIEDIHDGAPLLVGGFGLVGIPVHLIHGLRDKGVRDLTSISNN